MGESAEVAGGDDVMTTPTPTNPPLNAERFLLYGLEASGKTEGWFTLITDLPGEPNFYVIDCDGSVLYSLVGLADEATLKRVRVWDCSDPDGALIDPTGRVTYHAHQWVAFQEATTAIKKAKPKPNSWVIVDRLDLMWEAVQYHWIEGGYGSDFSAYWAELKKEQEAAAGGTERDYGGFMGARDWVPIKKGYHKAVRGLLSIPRANKLCTVLAKPPFDQSSKAKEQREVYGELMPAGESNQGADFFTVVQVAKKVDGTHQAWVRRTKRRGGIGELKNGKPVPVRITNEEGQPNFAKALILAHWNCEG